MATANFGISIAAWVLGLNGQTTALQMMFALVFALHLVGLMLVVLVRFRDRTAAEVEGAAQLAEGQRTEPAIS